jgi:hypothetical protein
MHKASMHIVIVAGGFLIRRISAMCLGLSFFRALFAASTSGAHR